MSTRYHFTLSSVPVTPAVNGSWGYVTERRLGYLCTDVNQGDTVTGASTVIGPWTAGQTALDSRLVSDPIGAQTISGTFKCQIRIIEPNSTDNVRTRLELYVVSGDGSTVRGTLLAIGLYGPNTEAAITTATNKTFASAGTALSSVAVQNGDRIVLCIGYSDASGTTPECASRIGSNNTGADLPEDETTTTSTSLGWCEFSMDIAPASIAADATLAGTGTASMTVQMAYRAAGVLAGHGVATCDAVIWYAWTGAGVLAGQGAATLAPTVYPGLTAAGVGTATLEPTLVKRMAFTLGSSQPNRASQYRGSTTTLNRS